MNDNNIITKLWLTHLTNNIILKNETRTLWSFPAARLLNVTLSNTSVSLGVGTYLVGYTVQKCRWLNWTPNKPNRPSINQTVVYHCNTSGGGWVSGDWPHCLSQSPGHFTHTHTHTHTENVIVPKSAPLPCCPDSLQTLSARCQWVWRETQRHCCRCSLYHRTARSTAPPSAPPSCYRSHHTHGRTVS